MTISRPKSTPEISDCVTATDDPCARVAKRLRERGWAVADRSYGRRRQYEATPRCDDHAGLTVIVRPAAAGLRADLQVRDEDGVWHLAPFCDGCQQRRVCELLSIGPGDLWSRDLFSDDEEMAA